MDERDGTGCMSARDRIGWSLIAGACALFLVAAIIFMVRGPGEMAFPSDATRAGGLSLAGVLSRGSHGMIEEDLEAETIASAIEEQVSAAVVQQSRRPDIIEDLRAGFVHGEKPASFQRYIMLHDTEGSGSPQSVVDWWDSSGQGVAAHFVIGKDGSIVQCVDMDAIAHHTGFGDTGHNARFGVEDESRDDKIGTTPIGSWASDYGMNSYSIGIEMVHIGGEGDYPEAQLQALDELIAYIDGVYGFESQIIDHKDWRTGNSDTSAEFAPYLQNYQDHRSHSAS